VPSAVEDLRDLQDAVGELVKIHAWLQILANAGTGTLQAEVEAVVIEGISVFGLVAKYQARVHRLHPRFVVERVSRGFKRLDGGSKGGWRMGVSRIELY
jgi:hypothetical protein